MRRFFLIMSVALGVAVACGSALTYDGSYYLYSLLEQGYPFVPNRRLLHAPLQSVVVLASQFTDNVFILHLVFGVAYVSMPLLALLACWWIVRQRAPGLFVWAAFGIGISTLPGQITFISEGAIVLQFTWALYLAILTEIRREHLPLLLLIALMMFFAHPGGWILFALAAALSVLTGIRFPAQRRARWLRAALFAMLAVGAYVRFVSGANVYELEQLGFSLLLTRFTSSVIGTPLIMLLGAGIAGLALLLSAWFGSWRGRRQRVIFGALLVSGLAAALFATVPLFWLDSLSYRFFIIPASLPFIAAAALDSPRRSSSEQPINAEWDLRQRVAERIALIFALVIIIQSVSWAVMSGSLRNTLRDARSGCVPHEASELNWTMTTALYHWSITPYSLLLQGRTPSAVILQKNRCETSDFVTGFPLADWDWRLWQGGWFDLHVLEQQLKGHLND